MMEFYDKVIEGLVYENLERGFEANITKDCYFYLGQNHSLLFSILGKVNKYWSGKRFFNSFFNENPELLDNYDFLSDLFFKMNPKDSDTLTDILIIGKSLMPKIFEDPRFIGLVYENDEFIGFLTTKKEYTQCKTESFLRQLMNHPRIHLGWLPDHFIKEHITSVEQAKELIKRNVINYQYIADDLKSKNEVIKVMVEVMSKEKSEIVIKENIENIPAGTITDEIAVDLSKSFSKYIYHKLNDEQKQNSLIFKNIVTEQIKHGNYDFLETIENICFKNDHNVISLVDAFLQYKPDLQSSAKDSMKNASIALYNCMKKIKKYNKDIYAIHQQNDYEDYAIGKKENLKNLLYSTFKRFWHEGSFDNFAHTVKAKILQNKLDNSLPLQDIDQKKMKI